MKSISIKNFITQLLIMFLLISIVLLGTSKAFAQKAPAQDFQLKSKTIDYTLPYAGLLPDSPFYIVKQARDALWVFFTRDPLKKAEVMLLLSDKKIVMAQSSADKGDWKDAQDMMQESEEHVTDIIQALNIADKTGSTAPADFVDKVKQSSEKHEEIMEDLLQKAPQGVEKDIETAIQLNIDHYNTLNSL